MATRDAWSNPIPIETAAVQSGAFMAKVYRWMALGLILTGLSAYAVLVVPALRQAIFGSPLVFYGLVIAEFAMVWAFSRTASTASVEKAAGMFLAYCLLSGLTFSVFFLVYTRESIAS